MTELSDFIQFNCRASTYADDLADAKLRAAFKALKEISEEEQGMVELLSTIYSVTSSITFSFDGREKQQLRDWKQAWEKVKGDPSRLWELRKHTPHQIMSAWIRAFNDAQSLFDVPDEQLPLNRLSPEQQAEAANPNSPLAEPIAAGK